MAGEGMSEAWNIAQFFARGRCPSARATSWSSTRRRRCPPPTWPGSSTSPTGRGARVILTGDTEQLGPGRGGRHVPADRGRGRALDQLAEVRRFDEAWERKASLQLRAGDWPRGASTAPAGRVLRGPAGPRLRRRGRLLADRHGGRGKTSLLLAGTNEEAARLAGLARERRIERGADPRRPGDHPPRREPGQPGRPGAGPAQLPRSTPAGSR